MCFEYTTHRPAEGVDGVGDVGDVLLLREVVRLEELPLLQAVLQQGLMEPANRESHSVWFIRGTLEIFISSHLEHADKQMKTLT